MSQQPELTPAELVEITGKRRPASQAAELAKRGIAFVFTGRGLKVRREVAMAYELMPANDSGWTLDTSKIR